ncbi:hypothetical protein HEK616_80070 (plasmid) [Streptomyces nigrescens]|uniref:Uncharacterized protein n=1 Tax=Streptomyces nigrescens TaxID=1920 RepID=A0ABN6RA96_STRNI|nr:hypothetical protein HEK616_80070 [Streptomyces nigrescens]
MHPTGGHIALTLEICYDAPGGRGECLTTHAPYRLVSTRPGRAESFTMRRTNCRLSACARLVLPDGRTLTVPEAAQGPTMENPARFHAELTSLLERT